VLIIQYTFPNLHETFHNFRKIAYCEGFTQQTTNIALTKIYYIFPWINFRT